MQGVNSSISSTQWVLVYLFAIVAANLSVARYGVTGFYVASFVVIPLDLVARDIIHQRWQGRGLVWRLSVLVATGAAITYAVNQDAARIAIASGLAFAAAATVNAIIYQLLLSLGQPVLPRMNFSNMLAALTDSSVFVALAFGFSWEIVLAQTGIKTIGAILWSFALFKFRVINDTETKSTNPVRGIPEQEPTQPFSDN